MKRVRLLDLAKQIRAAIDERFGNEPIWVEAETGNIRASQAGHVYLSLLEKSASGEAIAEVSAVVWSGSAVILRQFEEITGRPFAGNLKVCVLVRVAYHVRFGLKLVIEGIDVAYTIGELALERERTLQQLAADFPEYISYRNGQVDSANRHLEKRAVIQQIAVITAPDSEALADFMYQLDHNPFAYRFRVKLFPVAVQGEQAGPQMARAIQTASAESPDALVLIRGGGSQMDLYAFENAELAAAIARSPVPVLTGIGHHRNQAIADLVAHESLSTPTKVAEWLIDYARTFEVRILELQEEALELTAGCLEAEKQRLESASRGLVYAVRTLRESQRHRLERLAMATQHVSRLFLEKRKNAPERLMKDIEGSLRMNVLRRLNHLQLLEATVKQAAPDRILQRGFAMLSVDGKITANGTKIVPGQDLTVILADTEIDTTVKQVRLHEKKSS
ncbi:MAG: exodeoxyribonuclease VII large subunit [Bacteroidetes bacterium]|nr:MAG: exodeoxyribonuclease VII large subunit [Bacteroidota bacterium]